MLFAIKIGEGNKLDRRFIVQLFLLLGALAGKKAPPKKPRRHEISKNHKTQFTMEMPSVGGSKV